MAAQGVQPCAAAHYSMEDVYIVHLLVRVCKEAAQC